MKMTLPFRRALAGLAVFLCVFTTSASVFINEVCADNEAGFNVDGEYPDYVEFFNTNTVAVNISGWKLTLNATRLTDNNFTYIFPANTVINARSFLIVYCDGQTNIPLHTRFPLGKNGETLQLLGPANGFRDGVRFGFQVTDHPFGRVPDGTGIHQLCRPTPGAANGQVPLGNRSMIRINEWMPSRDVLKDWFEIYNPEPNPVSLSLLVFSDRSNIGSGCTNKATLTNSWLAAGGFLQFFADDHAEKGPDELDFKLSSGGDQIILFSQNRSNIFHRVFWPDPVKGLSNAELFTAYGWLPDGNTNDLAVVFPGESRATPGESNFLPITNVVVSEVISHTDLPLEDAIELYNPTASSVDIGGWWLSDSPNNHNKFQIPSGTIVPAGGYIVFYEYLGVPGGFNPNPGSPTSFSLNSAEGDDVFLFAVRPDGKLSGFRRGVDFPAMANGTSYGRYTTSTGESDFIPLESLTFGTSVAANDPPSEITTFRTGQGSTNAGPAIGPLVVNEIMYHPPDIISGTNIFDNELDEYVEIYNITTQPVKMWDTNTYPHSQKAFTNTWRLRGEVEFEFPTNITLGPGRSLIVVNFGLTNTIQLNTFRAKYNVPAGVQIFGAYRGNLSNGNGAVELERPDMPQPPGGSPFEGFVPYLRVDRVRYDDDPPWPTEPDGQRINPSSPSSLGYALGRKLPERYGGDPINWAAAVPSAGRQSISNYVSVVGNVATVSFQGLAGSGYTVQYRDDLATGGWAKLEDVQPQATSGPRQITNTVTPGARRFYRVVTPIQP